MIKKGLAMLTILLLFAAVSASSARSGVDRPVAQPPPAADNSFTMLPMVQNSYSSTLSRVQTRGRLLCGVNPGLPGFGYWDGPSYKGFDWDFCRALAAAVLGDATAVDAVPLTATERFTSLGSGAVDVLIRNTTHTLSRDSALLLNFAPTTFYDGQGLMARVDSGLDHLADFEGKKICVQDGTTTERDLEWALAQQGISADILAYANGLESFQAYLDGTCDGYTTHKTGLIDLRLSYASNPAAHKILEDTFTKEPLAPVVRHLDDNWLDVVSWTVNCTIAAEEYGVNSGNVDDFLYGYDPYISIMLGAEGHLGQYLGLADDFCYQVIHQVGNYAEIYANNLGPGTDFEMPRGFNRQYNDGGLLYAPPFR